jgi:hypothetical protein
VSLIPPASAVTAEGGGEGKAVGSVGGDGRATIGTRTFISRNIQSEHTSMGRIFALIHLFCSSMCLYAFSRPNMPEIMYKYRIFLI